MTQDWYWVKPTILSLPCFVREHEHCAKNKMWELFVSGWPSEFNNMQGFVVPWASLLVSFWTSAYNLSQYRAPTRNLLPWCAHGLCTNLSIKGAARAILVSGFLLACRGLWLWGNNYLIVELGSISHEGPPTLHEPVTKARELICKALTPRKPKCLQN